ncbi:glutamate-1-semialdehyde 2,1-aminomutase [Candidatus Magnetomoraceae bacterium gMMP-15]
MDNSISQRLFQSAVNLIPGGVNSPVRACRSVDSMPIFIEAAQGSMVFDADHNNYIDYIGSWGPMILGHRHPAVMDAIAEAVKNGISFGAPTKLEITLAEMIIKAIDSIEMVRMVNSGTEATMSAIRLARGFTGRDNIIKFDGCYHGHADSLLVEAGSGVATLGIPGSPGVPASFVKHTISLPYNDLNSVEKIMEQKGESIACIIVEPVAGNMGLVTPVDGFLEGLRSITQKYGSLLIFDEVMTGFRVAYGGAQEIYKISPDLTCLGKIIGGGMPVGAYGGKKEIMEKIAPQGPVYQAGTLSGNPVAMTAGIATLKELQYTGFYDNLNEKSEKLAKGLCEAARKADVPVSVARVGSMLGMFFTDRPVRNFEDAKTSDLNKFTAYYKGMLKHGIYLAPSQFEALFVSSAHTYEEIDKTLEAAQEVMKKEL